jgi:RecJ-like exonuclease
LRLRAFSNPEVAAGKLIEVASTVEAVQDGRIHIELVNLPFLQAGGSPDEYRAGIERAIANNWLTRHRSGAYVKFTPAGADLFA